MRIDKTFLSTDLQMFYLVISKFNHTFSPMNNHKTFEI